MTPHLDWGLVGLVVLAGLGAIVAFRSGARGVLAATFSEDEGVVLAAVVWEC